MIFFKKKTKLNRKVGDILLLAVSNTLPRISLVVIIWIINSLGERFSTFIDLPNIFRTPFFVNREKTKLLDIYLLKQNKSKLFLYRFTSMKIHLFY